jgi:hypothetical protein
MSRVSLHADEFPSIRIRRDAPSDSGGLARGKVELPVSSGVSRSVWVLIQAVSRGRAGGDRAQRRYWMSRSVLRRAARSARASDSDEPPIRVLARD